MLKNIVDYISEQSGGKVGTDLTFGESLMVLLVCMLVIFMVLIIIMGLLYLFKFFSILENKKVKNNPKPIVKIPEKDDKTDDEELVAAIVAALYAHEGLDSKTEPAPFIIKNIKRIK